MNFLIGTSDAMHMMLPGIEYFSRCLLLSEDKSNDLLIQSVPTRLADLSLTFSGACGNRYQDKYK